jgi:hypothetical protein
MKTVFKIGIVKTAMTLITVVALLTLVFTDNQSIEKFVYLCLAIRFTSEWIGEFIDKR